MAQGDGARTGDGIGTATRSAMKIVLGYSGGLDTSVIVPWLRERHGADVVCMAADVGQREGVDHLAGKAFATGASAFFGEDLREEFVSGYILPVVRAGAVYSRKYLLGTAMARPLISRRMVEVARETGRARWPTVAREGKRPAALRALVRRARSRAPRSSLRGGSGTSSLGRTRSLMPAPAQSAWTWTRRSCIPATRICGT